MSLILRNLLGRPVATVLSGLAAAATVFIFASLLSLDRGMERMLESTAHDEVITVIFAERFDREPVIDLVKSSLDDTELFYRFLRDSLYGETGEIELQPLQYELAAALRFDGENGVNRLITTNYDNLLERAYCRLHDLDEGSLLDELEVIARKRDLDDSADSPRFIHLHGYLPPDSQGQPRGDIVLSESDYLQTLDSWQTVFLHEEVLLTPDRDLLIVGMSMADPRLRRLLHKRANCDDECGQTFLFLPKSSAVDDAPLAVRRAHKLLGDYETRYWDGLDVGVKLIENLDMLPFHLRRIRLDDDPVQWCLRAKHHLEEETENEKGRSVLGRLYDELKQREANHLLRQGLVHLRSRFEISSEEELTIGFFVPSPDDEPHIQLAFRCNEQVPGDYLFEPDDDTRKPFQGVTGDRGRNRKLRVATRESAQGVAGYSFATGAVIEALHSSPALNREFDDEMLKSWDDGRTFSALLCIPIYGSPDWLPLGVGFVSSNRKQPFWNEISEADTLTLYREIRTTFRKLLEY